MTATLCQKQSFVFYRFAQPLTRTRRPHARKPASVRLVIDSLSGGRSAVGYSGAVFLAGFTSFRRVTSSSAGNLPCRGLGTTGTTTPLDLVRLVRAPLAQVKLVGFFVGILDSVTFTVYESGAKQVEAGPWDNRNCCFYRVLH